jgi:hypothetical protein
MECPALKRTLDPFARELMLLECMLALVQSLFVKHTQASTFITRGVGCPLDDETVVRTLLKTTQIEGVII